MIDEKKIEEAAETKAIEGGFLEAAPIVRIAFSNGFHAGINWFLDNLWHDASEEPKSNTIMATCLVKHKDGMQKVRYYDTEYKRWIDEYSCDISCWLYVNDLLKGGK